jgi:DNA-binding PadR family transcriptional regulator
MPKIEENANYGFIKLYRSIKKHWIWKDEQRLKWWVDVLLEVNHSDEKILIGNELMECKKGQTIRSLLTWSKEWKVSVGSVRRFFDLLEKDSMIVTENLKKTTRLTVCNYEVYADWRNVDGKQTERRRNADGMTTETNNNGKNDNNDKNIVANATVPDSEMRQKYSFVLNTDIMQVCKFIRENKPRIHEPYVDLWNLFAEKKGKAKVEAMPDERKRKLRARLRDPKFDLEKILSTAKDRPGLMEKDADWFCFDWLIKNQTNYNRILEGQFKTSFKNGTTKTQRANFTDRFKDIDKQFGQADSESHFQQEAV